MIERKQPAPMKSPGSFLLNKETVILQQWMSGLEAAGTRVTTIASEEEWRRYSTRLLGQLLRALESGEIKNFEGKNLDPLREALGEISRVFAERGLSATETATYILSLKEPLFKLYQLEYKGDELAEKTWEISAFLDQMGLFTFEAYTRTRESIIKSQAESLAELSTPVIQVWEGVIALPLVGAISSVRAKEILEKLLNAVVTYEADVVILDITGVPVVDSQVANRLMRTVEAVRLLGSDAIITGINPIIAQTLVQLGVDLGTLVTKSSLRAGLKQAFRQLKLQVIRLDK
jgi:rsbT co-antagonist protein RsbR